MKLNWNFLRGRGGGGGGGVIGQIPSVGGGGGYGYFLEPHNANPESYLEPTDCSFFLSVNIVLNFLLKSDEKKATDLDRILSKNC